MIHKYQYKDQYIVLDVNSGAVHVVNDIVYDILDYYEEKSLEEIPKLLAGKYKEEDILDALEDIRYLVDHEMLFADDSQVTLDMLEGRGAVIKAMCLHAAHDCNMTCKYCFGDKGAFEGERSLLSLETGKKAIDFLLAHSGSRRNLEIDFFGGEPLMNFDVVKALVAYGREAEKAYGKNIRFTITTNGLLLDDAMIELIFKSAPLHDIGKIGVPDKILLKPGKLDAEEYAIMQTHAELGRRAIEAAEKRLGASTFLAVAKEIAFTHHERWDGSGYPQGLSKIDIPLSGRLMAIADVYDALVSERVYKKAIPHMEAVALIRSEKGKHFDPVLVDLFEATAPIFDEIHRQFIDP